MKREIQLMKRLSHPNIVELYGFTMEPRPLCVMELLQDGTLSKRMGTGPRSPKGQGKYPLTMVPSHFVV